MKKVEFLSSFSSLGTSCMQYLPSLIKSVLFFAAVVAAIIPTGCSKDETSAPKPETPETPETPEKTQLPESLNNTTWYYTDEFRYADDDPEEWERNQWLREGFLYFTTSSQGRIDMTATSKTIEFTYSYTNPWVFFTFSNGVKYSGKITANSLPINNTYLDLYIFDQHRVLRASCRIMPQPNVK